VPIRSFAWNEEPADLSAIDDIGNSSDEELLQLARSGNNYITPIPDLQRLTIVVAEMLVAPRMRRSRLKKQRSIWPMHRPV
jgi:hypothetical protein